MVPTAPLTLVSGLLDPASGLLHRNIGPIRLRQKELALLLHLVEQTPRVVPREELLQAIWGYGPDVLTRTLDTTIARLRQKIEPDPGNPVHVHTVSGEGYRFQVPPPAALSPAGPVRTTFVGRAPEQARLHQAMQAPARRVALVGPAGVGKTRLATRWTWQNVPADQRVVCDLASACSEAALLQVVEDALGLPHALDGRAERIGTALASPEPTLLLLDNADDLPEAVAALSRDWLDAAPTLRVLITARARLPGVPCVEVAPLPVDDALLLFQERLERPTAEADQSALRALVEGLDCLPLAIEMAAGRARVLSPTQLLDHLGDRFHLLRFPSNPTGARVRTLHEAIAWSWGLLSPEEQRTLSWISILPGPFTAETAARLLEPADVPSPADALDALERAGLLQVIHTPQGRRLRLLQNIRAFAWAALERSGGARACGDRLLAWCLEQVERDSTGRTNGTLPAHEDFAVREGPDIRVAMAHGLRHDPDKAARLLLEMLEAPTWRRAEALAWLDDLAAADLRPPLRARLLLHRAYLHLQAGRVSSAEELLQEGLALAERLQDQGVQGRLLATFGELAIRQGALDQADAYLSRAEALLTEAAPTLLNRVYVRRGTLNQYRGRFAEARRWDQRGAAHSQRYGAVYQEMVARSNFACGLSDVGRWAESDPHALAALAYFERIQDRRGTATMRHLLAANALRQGQIERGDGLLLAAMEAYRKAGDFRGIALIQISQTDTLLARQGPEPAARLAREAWTKLHSIGELRLASLAAAHLAAIEAERGHLTEAEALLRAIAEAPDEVVWDDGYRAFAACWLEVARAEQAPTRARSRALRRSATTQLQALRERPASSRPLDWIIDRLAGRLRPPPRS
ncbi:MAG: winged helix-turn-helix domain-containing protein [Alphaproteobacteria bacterium]|nr:winged helix-turn-helix domain-containing protein [Alphaproteobacteria bacterium]